MPASLSSPDRAHPAHSQTRGTSMPGAREGSAWFPSLGAELGTLVSAQGRVGLSAYCTIIRGPWKSSLTHEPAG